MTFSIDTFASDLKKAMDDASTSTSDVILSECISRLTALDAHQFANNAEHIMPQLELGKVYDSVCKLKGAYESSNIQLRESSTSDVIIARQIAATKVFRATLEKYSIDELMTVLKDSIPPGASIGEMIIHSSDELTILYGKVPPKFQSAVHNHTIFACICCLIGHEQNTIYTLNNGSMDVPPNVEKQFTVQPGQVIELPADVIHSISNPDDSVAHLLHIYGGDFKAVMNERTLWSSEELKAMPFSFPGLMKECCVRMKLSGNDEGLDAVADAIPSLVPVINEIVGKVAAGDDPAVPVQEHVSQ